MTRGGSRLGAGRKSPLDGYQALSVGLHYELLLNKTSEKQAFQRQNKTSAGRAIAAAQDRAELVGHHVRKYGTPKEITEDIDYLTGRQRFISIPLKRPYGARAAIIKEVIKWCDEEYGRIISPSKVVECWKQYKRFQKKAKK